MATFNNPRKTAATVTASATLAKGSHTPVDATAAPITVTLPTGTPAGVEISVEKVDTSANAVVVSGTMRGAGGSTISLTYQYEGRTFLSEGNGSWRPTSDHRTSSTLTTIVTSALAADSTPKTAAANAVADALANGGVVKGANPIDEVTAGYQFIITDSAGRIGFGINNAGHVVGVFDLAADSIPFVALKDNPIRNASGAGYQYVITDANDKIALAVLDDGSIQGKFTVGDGTVTTAKLDPAIVKRLSVARSKSDHASLGRKLLARDPSGAVRPHVSTNDWAAWGDSLTEGWPQTAGDFTSPTTQSWPGVLATLLTSGTVYNGGKTGQSVDEIALRQGGLVMSLSVSGGSIPASGGVTVVEDQLIGWYTSRAWSSTGTLAGVPGTLSRNGTATLTFTRTTSGSAVPVSGSAPFYADQSEAYKDRGHIIFAGRNNIGAGTNIPTIPGSVSDQIIAATVAMVERQTAMHPRFLLVGTLTATTETRGTSGYNDVLAANTALAELYPDNFYDLRAYLVNQAIYDLGITPTATDLTKIANDTLPPSIMATNGTDAVHYSVATAAKVAAQMKAQLVTRGWAS